VWALAHCLLLFIDSFWSFAAFFFLFGTASTTFNQARQNIVMEFGDTQDIPLRLATSHMTFNTIAALGPLVGGVIAFMFDHSVIFIICMFMQILAAALMIKRIPEPRQTGDNLTVAVTKDQ
jgi:MFS family permease